MCVFVMRVNVYVFVWLVACVSVVLFVCVCVYMRVCLSACSIVYVPSVCVRVVCLDAFFV